MFVYTKYPEQELAVLVVKGDTTIDEWLDALTRYDAEGPMKYELYDLRQQTTPLSSDDIHRIVQLSEKDRHLRPPEGKTAIIVGDALKFGLARMYELMSEIEGVTWETKPFYTVDEAAGWLGKDVAGLLENVVAPESAAPSEPQSD
ncbi:MAG: hypothetical protein GY851_22415 [bacterium]|nr:hypothetical protein [bacterium]